MWNQGSRAASILRRKDIDGGVTVSDLKLCHRAEVTKAAGTGIRIDR